MSGPPIDNKISETEQQKFDRLHKALGLDRVNEDLKDQREKLDQITHQLGDTNQTLNNVVTELNKLIAHFQNNGTPNTQPAGVQNTILGSNLPLETKVQMLTSIGDAAAKIVTAYKGSTPSMDPMGDLGKQMLTDLVRATVDDIQQRVYGIRKLPPPNIIKQASHGIE